MHRLDGLMDATDWLILEFTDKFPELDFRQSF